MGTPEHHSRMSGHAHIAEDLFKQRLLTLESPSILELGTLRWNANNPTHHKSWAPDGSTYVMSDIQEGLDVDVAADGHTLKPFKTAEFDAYIAISVYEHLRQPWKAAKSARRVLKKGGIAFVLTHQTFPIHGYPSDFFRFSDAALSSMFEDVGFSIIDRGYQYPCQIRPPGDVTVWNYAAESYLNVAIFAEAI